MFFLLPLLGEVLLGGAVLFGGAMALGVCMDVTAELFDELADAEGAEQERVKARVVAHVDQHVQQLRSLDVQHRRAELAQLEALLASKSLSADKRRWLNEQLARLRRELGE